MISGEAFKLRTPALFQKGAGGFHRKQTACHLVRSLASHADVLESNRQ